MDNNQEKTVQQEQPEVVKEQKQVLVIGTTQKEVATYLKGYCTKKKIELIQMKEEELQAYLKSVNATYKDSVQNKTLEAFVKSKENREEAYNQAVKLYNILTRGANIENAGQFEFTSTQAVHETTLSHNKFQHIFEVWELFNFVKRTEKNRFRFTFNKNDQRQAIQNGVFSLVRAMVSDITRYNANIDADDTMSDEEKKETKRIMIDKILEELK